MDWIFDNFQILAIVALAFASWLKHRSDVRKAAREEQEAREEMSEVPDWFEDGEWQQPQPTPPPLVPPPLEQRAAPPPLSRRAPPPVPELVQAGNTELQRQEDIQERLQKLRETRESTARQAKQARQAREARQARTARTARSARLADTIAAPTAGGRLRVLLRDRSQIRQAIVMREILGPPVAMRRNHANSPMSSG